jgi:hypothetical protein
MCQSCAAARPGEGLGGRKGGIVRDGDVDRTPSAWSQSLTTLVGAFVAELPWSQKEWSGWASRAGEYCKALVAERRRLRTCFGQARLNRLVSLSDIRVGLVLSQPPACCSQ